MKHIIGAPSSFGQMHRGVILAPNYFTINHNINFETHTGYQKLYSKIRRINNKERILTIGGDHSIGVSTINAVNDTSIANNKRLSVIWVDAHADINTYKTTKSNNTHGMVVAFLLGLCKFQHIKFVNVLCPSQIHYIGLRDVEHGEFDILKQLRINYYTSHDVYNYGILSILHQIKEKVKNDDIHISFDVDALSPHIMPCTGTIVRKGLTLDDAINIMRFFDKKQFRTADIVEFNPEIGNDTDLDISLCTINTIIQNL